MRQHLKFFRPMGWIVVLLVVVTTWFALPQSLRHRLQPTAQAFTTFTVTNTNDDGPGSLRNAIVTSNQNPGPNANVISFNIPGTGVKTISPVSPLPTITGPVNLAALTDPVFPNGRLIELNGTGAGSSANGLTITAGHCTISGLAINRFSGAGIDLQSSGANTISNNYIGTDTVSLNGLGNSLGVQIAVSSANNIVENNTISANTGTGISIASAGNTIRGNHLGIGGGAVILGNGGDGILLINAANNIIGPGNIIASSGGDGVELRGAGSTGNKIQGNHIGVNSYYFTAPPRPNNGDGVLITDSASNNLIGEVDPDNPGVGANNVINLNAGAGVHIAQGSANKVHKNQILGNTNAGVRVEEGTGNAVLGNGIQPNGALGIDLGPPGITANDSLDGDAGANNLQNFPVMNLARQVFYPYNPEYYLATGFITGTINSTPNTTLRLDFFLNDTCDQSGYGNGQFQAQQASVTTGSDGNASFNVNVGMGLGSIYTVTATDASGNTSEFSQCIVAVSAGSLGLNPGYSVNENAGTATITVRRTGGSNGTVTVDYATSNGTAVAGSDYLSTSGKLTFADGELSKSFTIPILNDALVENAETINLTLSNPGGGAGLAFFGGHGRVAIFDDDSPRPPTIFAIDSNHLMSFNSELPEQLLSYVPLTGVLPDESIFKIAFRPLTGQLYGVSFGHLYTINKTTAVATPVGVVSSGAYPSSFHFNPVTDRIRLETYANQNLQLNPDTGQIISVDTPASFAPGDVSVGRRIQLVALANTNNFAGATSTTTYAVNYDFNDFAQSYVLMTLGSVNGVPFSPNSGQLFTIRPLTSFFEEVRGLDFTDDGIGFIAVSPHDEGTPYLRKLLPNGSATNAPLTTDLVSLAIIPTQHLQFSAGLYSMNENAGALTVTVRRTGGSSGTVSVNYSTSDGTASAGEDYSATSGSLTFADGETSKIVTIPLMDDSAIEGVENFNLILSSASGGAVVGPQSTATIAIMDEPAAPGTNPIDNADFFVHQHYADFLSRQPDLGGLTFWTNHITQCFNDRACINERRVGMSAAFFIENEFQQTGFFIYRFYQAALGRRPSFAEFSADRVKVVGGANLETGKQTFATEFVQRQDFLQKYPPGMDGPAFVDALLVNAGQASGVMDLATRRDALIAQFNQGATQTEGRVRVVRALIDDSVFSASLYNPAFVLMQYFGYLRRPPDQQGYDFWLDHLNNRNPNNYRAMVCAFITSGEYQRRFSSIITRSDQDCAH